MKVIIAWWNLDESEQTIESMQKHLAHDTTDAWDGIDGLKSKIWISDTEKNIWGAIMVWESSASLLKPLPPNRAQQLIGYKPSLRIVFNLEKIINKIEPTTNKS